MFTLSNKTIKAERKGLNFDGLSTTPATLNKLRASNISL